MSASFYKSFGYFSEGIFRPFHEPIDRSIVDECRVHAAIVTELLSNRRHADRDVKISTHSVQEEFVDSVRGFNGSRHHEFEIFTNCFSNSLQFFRVKEVRYFSRAQNITHIF